MDWVDLDIERKKEENLRGPSLTSFLYLPFRTGIMDRHGGGGLVAFMTKVLDPAFFDMKTVHYLARLECIPSVPDNDSILS